MSEELDALALAAQIRQDACQAREVLEEAINRIRKRDPQVNALAAESFDAARMAVAPGVARGPFFGVPFLHKDLAISVAGLKLNAGSRLFGDVISTRDGTLAARQRAAGLVFLGRTTTAELGLNITTETEAFGDTRNPWNLAHSVGGSSGGAAAAVAAGYVPLAHGTDAAGSIRIPAAHCGLFGFKPSRIRNPAGPDVAEGMAGLAVQHCVSRSVRDSAALLDVTHGPDIGDPYAAPPMTGTFLSAVQEEPRPLRIAWSSSSPLGTPVDPVVAAAVERAAILCVSLGHRVTPAAPDYDAHGLMQAWRVIAGVSTAVIVDAQAQRRNLVNPLDLLEPVNAAWTEEGWRASATDYARAVALLHRTGRALGAFFQNWDVFLSPVTAEPAPRLGELSGKGKTVDTVNERFWTHAPFTTLYNAAGCPAMSLPLGTTPDGLPVGVQFGAALGAERMLFALAGQIERAAPWPQRAPLG